MSLSLFRVERENFFVVTEFYITSSNSTIYLSREYNIYLKINYLDI
jgi:hypothetical protein